jgi:hypothetical protein
VRHKKPYVEDFGSNLKSGKLAATLNGALDPFLESRLRRRSGSSTTQHKTIEEG